MPALRFRCNAKNSGNSGKISVKCQKLTDIFFVKALYDMRESVILGMDQRRKPQEKEGTKQMKFDMHCHTKEGSMDGKVPIDDFIAELIRKGFNGIFGQ